MFVSEVLTAPRMARSREEKVGGGGVIKFFTSVQER